MRAGTLVVDIAANVARLQKDMQDAKGVVAGAMNDISRSVNVAKTALGALGVGLSAGALASMTANIVKATAALDDMAETTGATVEELSKLQHVARIGGKDFSMVEDGLVKLTKGLRGTEEETKNARNALEQLGIQAKTATGQLRDPGEIMREVAGKLAQFEDGAGKTAIALDLFGKSGAKLLPFLKDLSEEGSVAARVTAEQAAQAEKLEKAIARLQVAGEDARRTFVLAWIDDMVDLAEKMNMAAKAGGNLATALLLVAGGNRSVGEIDAEIASIEGKSGLRKFMENGATMGYAGMADQARLSLLYRQRDYQRARVERDAAAAPDDMPLPGKARLNYRSVPEKKEKGDGEDLVISLQNQLAAAQGEASVFDATMRKLTEGTKQYSIETQAAALALAGQIDEEKRATEVRKQANAVAEAYAKTNDQQLEAMQEVERSLKLRTKEIENETGLVNASAATREKANEFLRIENQLRQASIALTPDQVASLRAIAEAEKERIGAAIDAKVAREEGKKAADEAAAEWKRAQESMWQSIDRTAHDTFVSIFDSGKNAFDRLKDTLKNGLYDLLYQMTVRPFIVQIAASVGGVGAAGSALAGGGGGGGGGSIGNLLSLGNSASNLFGGENLLGNIGSAFGLGGGVLSSTAVAGEIAALTGSGVAVGGALGTGAVAASSVLPWVGGALAVGSALGIFGGGGIFGKKKKKKPADMYLSRDSSGRFYIWGDDVPGPSARSDFAYLEAALNDPLQYDQDILAGFEGKNFRGGVGERADSLLPKFLEHLAPARQAAQATVSGWNAKLSGAGVLAGGIANYVGGMTVSEYLSPEKRLEGARSLYDNALDLAGAGDAAASAALPGLAQQLLGAGRSVYASGPQFQGLFEQVNNDLARVLEQQGAAQEAILAEMPAALREANQDTVAQLKALREDIKAGLAALNQGLRSLGGSETPAFGMT